MSSNSSALCKRKRQSTDKLICICSHLLIGRPSEDDATHKHATHVAPLDGGEEGESFAHQMPLKQVRIQTDFHCYAFHSAHVIHDREDPFCCIKLPGLCLRYILADAGYQFQFARSLVDGATEGPPDLVVHAGEIVHLAFVVPASR